MLGLCHLLKLIQTVTTPIETFSQFARYGNHEELRLVAATVKDKQNPDAYKSEVYPALCWRSPRSAHQWHKPTIFLNQNQTIKHLSHQCRREIIREKRKWEGKFLSVDEVNHPVAQAEKTKTILKGPCLVPCIFKSVNPKNQSFPSDTQTITLEQRILQDQPKRFLQ